MTEERCVPQTTSACEQCAHTWELTWQREYNRPENHRLYPNFLWPEVACNCCLHLHLKSDLLLRKLQTIRSILNTPLRLSSGWRCDAHNEVVGGSRLHPAGIAADILVHPDKPAEWRFTVVEAALTASVWGIGVANSFIHLDWMSRPHPRVWTYDKGKS